MKKGLLIEDDQIKADKIIEYIYSKFSKFIIIHKLSYQSGIKEIFNSDYDFILLDMSIPTYDLGQGNYSGKPKNYGGMDILKEMKRYKRLSKVKIITQYNEFDGGLKSIAQLDSEMKSQYSGLYNGYIYYNSRQSKWMDDLSQFLNTL